MGIEITQNLFSGSFIQDTTNKGGYVYAELLKQGFMIRPTDHMEVQYLELSIDTNYGINLVHVPS